MSLHGSISSSHDSISAGDGKPVFGAGHEGWGRIGFRTKVLVGGRNRNSDEVLRMGKDRASGGSLRDGEE